MKVDHKYDIGEYVHTIPGVRLRIIGTYEEGGEPWYFGVITPADAEHRCVRLPEKDLA